MHDNESDAFVFQTWPEKVESILKSIGVNSTAKERGTDSVEKGDYYSRVFSQSTRMITNLGVVELTDYNIDVIQIIQKG